MGLADSERSWAELDSMGKKDSMTKDFNGIGSNIDHVGSGLYGRSLFGHPRLSSKSDFLP